MHTNNPLHVRLPEATLIEGLSKISSASSVQFAPGLISLHAYTDGIARTLRIENKTLQITDDCQIQLSDTTFYPDQVETEIGKKRLLREFENVTQKIETGSDEELLSIPVPISHIDDMPLQTVLENTRIKLIHLLGGPRHLTNPRRFASVLAKLAHVRNGNALTYLAGPVPPGWLWLLSYAGIDLFDNSYALFAASRGLLLNELLPIQDNEILAFDGTLQRVSGFKDLAVSNTVAMIRTLKAIMTRLRQGTLRTEVEASVHNSPSLASLLRLMDNNKTFHVGTNSARSTPVVCIGSESYTRPEMSIFRSRVSSTYDPRNPAAFLLLPCSAKKPYFLSRSHNTFYRAIHAALRKKAHQIRILIISSPIGVVPEELSMTFPAAHYDIPVTGHWSQEEAELTRNSLGSILDKKPGTRVISYLPAGYEQILSGEDGFDIIPISGSAVKQENLSRLEEKLRAMTGDLGETVTEDKNLPLRRFKAVADHQFGQGTGEDLASEAVVRGKYPRFQHLLNKKELLATMRPSNGLLTLSLKGAERLAARTQQKVVFAGDELRGSSLFAKGVLEANPEIRPGDEVLIVNQTDELLGVGHAVLPGQWMTKTSYGIAVRIRHKQH